MDEDDPQKAGENVAQSGFRSGQSDWGSTQGPVYFAWLPSLARPLFDHALGLSRQGVADRWQTLEAS
jgi:hypothetical protein